jgi:hypothetical protein
MVRVNRIVLLTLLASAFLLTAETPSPRPSVSNNYYYSGNWYYTLPARSQEKHQTNAEKTTAQPLSGVPQSGLSQQATNPTNQSPKSPQDISPVWRILIALWEQGASWALVAVAIWAACIALNTLKSIQSQGEIAMKAADAAERSAKALIEEKVPYLFVENVLMEMVDSENPILKSHAVSIVLRNYAVAPAFLRTVCTNCDIMKTPQPLS